MTPFRKRTTCPNPKMPAYCVIEGGGKNHSIRGNSAGRVYQYSVLPNCTGYVHGRCIEILGTDEMLCRGNAENYWNYADGFRRSQTPTVGAIMCWRKGKAGNSSDGAGHVAFVEEVNSAGDVVASESGWTGTQANGRYWRLRRLRRVNGSYALGTDFRFQGFIHIYEPMHVHSIRHGVYRLYNPNGNQHMFTLNNGEANSLVRAGWRYEGIAWKAPTAGRAVYRLYNANNGDHVLTINVVEKDALRARGWRYECIAMFSDASRAVPVYRLYNANSGEHFYTADYSERDSLIRRGWRYECIALYGEK